VLLALLLMWWRMRPEPIEVAVVAAGYGQVEQTVSNTRAGTIKACRRSKVSMPMGGVVDKLLVDEGDRVEQGQLLLELWNRDRYAEVANAEASLNVARHGREQACVLARRSERDAQRQQSLLARKLTSVEAADNALSNAAAQRGACAGADAQIMMAEAQLALQQAVLERTQLKAPFAGVVAEINGELGEYITPSPPGVATPPAVDLIDTSCLYVTAPIDEVDAGALQLGMPVRITLDAFRGRSFVGKLTRIAPYVLDVEKQARTVDIDVRFDAVPADLALLVGYSADATVVLREVPRALRIPTEALVSGNRVWLLNDGELVQRELELGVGNWTWTEIKKGLQEGEQVVRSPDQPGIAEGVPALARGE
jgi:HlyD family secretion protein